MKKLLIITGPQGSGNHLFSRLLSLHKDVSGWEELLENYWIPSDQEPFAEYWVDPKKLTIDKFEGKDYHLANVSCPFFFDGKRYIPNILGLAKQARKLGVDVQIAIIVRDQNINKLQQLRVRKEHTTPIAMKYYKKLFASEFPIHFLDHEAFFMYKKEYLSWVGKMLNFPVSKNNLKINRFINKDANHKYVKYVEEYWLDETVLKGCEPTRNKRIKK